MKDATQLFWEQRWALVKHEPNPFERAKVERLHKGFPEGVETILDVGCGTGWMLEMLSDHWDYAVGVDYSIEGLKRARIPCVQGSGFALPFPNDAFDLLLCTEVIEHLDDGDLKKLLGELRRVSSRYVMITTPFAERRELAMIRCDRCVTVFHGSLHLRTWTKDSLRQTFAANGLDAVWIDTSGRRPFRSRMISALNSHLTGYYAADPRTCPVCGNSKIVLPRARENVVSLALESINLLLGKIVPAKAYSLCGLFEKRSEP